VHAAHRTISWLRICLVPFVSHGADVPVGFLVFDQVPLLERTLAVGDAGAVAVFRPADAIFYPSGLTLKMFLVRSVGMNMVFPMVVVTVSMMTMRICKVPVFLYRNERHATLRTFSRLVIALGSFAFHRTLIVHIDLRK
jgi:hypothetical protein